MPERKVIAVVGATGAQGGGLVRAILRDRNGGFKARALTRKPHEAKARALEAAGAEIVAADLDDAASLDRAFAGAHGVYAVTNFWEHMSPERELAQAAAIAQATKRAGVAHVVWSTLEDTRRILPLDDPRLPVLGGHYNVPHLDAKGEADAVFAHEAAPTSYLVTSFYWDNFIGFGMGPKPNEKGDLILGLPLGGVPLPGISAEDIGRCAYGVFRRGPEAAGTRFGIAGEILTGDQMAAGLTQALGRTVTFYDVPFDTYRSFGFPGADDLANMFQFQAIASEEFIAARDPHLARELNPELQSFADWAAANAAVLPID